MKRTPERMSVPAPQIAAKIPEVVETILQERIWCMFEEPQVAAKILEVIKVLSVQCVDAAVPRVDLAESLGEAEAAPPRSRTSDTTSAVATTVDTAGEKADGEARPLGIVDTSVAKPTGEVGEIQPPVTAKCSATTRYCCRHNSSKVCLWW